MKEITSLQELTSIFDTEDYCLIYKFNPSNCSLSDRTRPLVEQRLEKNTIPGRRIDIINHKEISDACVERVCIEHQSPQALRIHAGKVIAHASHMHISMEWLDTLK